MPLSCVLFADHRPARCDELVRTVFCDPSAAMADRFATIEAKVDGSSDAVYDCKAVIRRRDGALHNLDCTCPFKADQCKHVVAILLRCSDDPTFFGLPASAPCEGAAGTAGLAQNKRRVDPVAAPTPPNPMVQPATPKPGASMAKKPRKVPEFVLLLNCCQGP